MKTLMRIRPSPPTSPFIHSTVLRHLGRIVQGALDVSFVHTFPDPHESSRSAGSYPWAHVPACCGGSQGRPRRGVLDSLRREGARRTPWAPRRRLRTLPDAVLAHPAAPGCAPRARAALGRAAGARAPAHSPRPRTRSAAVARLALGGPVLAAARRWRRTAPGLLRLSTHSASFPVAWAREHGNTGTWGCKVTPGPETQRSWRRLA